MQIEIAQPKQDHVEQAVVAMLSENAQITGFPYQPQPLVLKVCDEGQVVAGLVGHTNWDWLYIETLAVAAQLRGQGWGRKLVTEAERIAIERQCRGAWVDTFTFQSPEFYERLGYQPFGQLPDYPVGQRRVFLRKLFAQ
ncbi:GNAT family N-acetyltransferase [Blastopirellula marina]|uniref:N-acetyltransferase n=1 Tax=Blastopirellula marina TaxID=124 RepID=A0A2S8F6T5_9BACT|nr:GNAT family N-acetyltransferase [Blastopirellula marina]PQO27863.1 N-acetyltransferase [Blastopirellula marina]PTL41598.1 N-acetyltransferase [Blastopirellula marina]